MHIMRGYAPITPHKVYDIRTEFVIDETEINNSAGDMERRKPLSSECGLNTDMSREEFLDFKNESKFTIKSVQKERMSVPI